MEGNNIEELVKMLTILSYFMPNIKDIHNSIYVEYCVAQAKHYCMKKNAKEIRYWSNLANKYLLKRIDYVFKKRAN